MLDPVTEVVVRRLNVIVYSNYGEPNARIIHGRDHDFEDRRTPDYNKEIERRIQALAVEARRMVEDWEQRKVERVKNLLRRYYVTKDEQSKREFESENALHPFIFSRAWRELREGRDKAAAAAAALPEKAPLVEEVLYPLDPELREIVLDIERVIADLEADLGRLKDRGVADDILVQTCRKLVARARETLQGASPSDFNLRRLEMARGSLVTTWRQVKSRLRGV